MNHIADVATNPDMLMFIDEAANNHHTLGRSRSWAFTGDRCIQHRFFVHGQRFYILPVLTIDGLITHDIILGSINVEHFFQFLQELVIPLTNPTLALKVSSSSTTAISIILKRSGPWLKMRRCVNLFSFPLIPPTSIPLNKHSPQSSCTFVATGMISLCLPLIMLATISPLTWHGILSSHRGILSNVYLGMLLPSVSPVCITLHSVSLLVHVPVFRLILLF